MIIDIFPHFHILVEMDKWSHKYIFNISNISHLMTFIALVFICRIFVTC